MQPDQAKFLAETYLGHLNMEHRATTRVISSVPADHAGYKPDPKCMSAIELAWHLGSSEIWFLNGVVNGAFVPPEDGKLPENIQSGADAAAYYEKEFPAAVEKLSAMSGEDLAKPVSFFGVFNFPVVEYLGFATRHSVHHRGQLSAYLRPMGSKVPQIYGGSADEPFEHAAAAEGASGD